MTSCPVCSGPSQPFSVVRDRDREGESWQIRRCRKCGYGWTLPPIGPEDIGAYYPPAYLGDSERTLDAFLAGRLQKSRSWRRETEKVAFLERFVPGGAILDVGCSNASFLLALDEKRWKRVGVEYIGEVVHLVRRKIPSLEIHHGGIGCRRLDEGSFDVITFWHVFEHLHEPGEVLRRAYRLLRPGGRVVISAPNFDSAQARIFRRHWYAFDVPRHLHHFSPASLDILLTEAGLVDCQHLFFSRMSNIHQLKHSLIHWSETVFSSRIPYYLLKPLLFGFQALETMGLRYGTVTAVARKPTRS